MIKGFWKWLVFFFFLRGLLASVRGHFCEEVGSLGS